MVVEYLANIHDLSTLKQDGESLIKMIQGNFHKNNVNF